MGTLPKMLGATAKGQFPVPLVCIFTVSKFGNARFETNWCLQTPKCQNGNSPYRTRHECGCFGGIRIPIENTKSLRGFRIGSWGHLYGPPTPVQKLIPRGPAINWSLPKNGSDSGVRKRPMGYSSSDECPQELRPILETYSFAGVGTQN